MAPEPQEQISQFTEISDQQVVGWGWYLTEAVFWGSLAGTVSQIVLLIPVFGVELIVLLLLLGLPLGFFVAATLTLLGMVFVGLPITAILQALNLERTWLYSALGAIAGFVTLVLLFELPISIDLGSLTLAGSGGLAGLACAYRWGRWRERVAKSRQAERENRAAQRRTNPIHELIH